MNFQFNMAVHILTFLAKHYDEQYTSSEIAESVCVNSVQLRKVLSVLKQNQLVTSQQGKSGGYVAVPDIEDISLGKLFRLFMPTQPTSKVFTGSSDNPCTISQKIESVMSGHYSESWELTAKYYDNYSIKDIKNNILEGEK